MIEEDQINCLQMVHSVIEAYRKSQLLFSHIKTICRNMNSFSVFKKIYIIREILHMPQ